MTLKTFVVEQLLNDSVKIKAVEVEHARGRFYHSEVKLTRLVLPELVDKLIQEVYADSTAGVIDVRVIC